MPHSREAWLYSYTRCLGIITNVTIAVPETFTISGYVKIMLCFIKASKYLLILLGVLTT